MTELEQTLLALGGELEWPAVPDLASRVAARVEPPRGRPRTWLRPLAVAVALVALAIGIAFAVPQARSAILRWLHIRGATVVRVKTLPRAQERNLARDLGDRMSVEQAEKRVGYRLVLPRGVDHVYVAPNLFVSAIVRAPKPLLLTEFRSGLGGGGILKKVGTFGTRVEYVDVGGETGVWVAGEHVLIEPSRVPALIRGHVLIWLRGALTLRLEGQISRKDAIAFALGLR
jgi:hypothetical protein